MKSLTAAKVFWVRLLAVTLVAAASLILSRVDMLLVTVALLFAHYPLAFFFSARTMSRMTDGWKVWRSLGFILGLSVVLIFLDPFSWGLYFAIHHALTEGFLLPDENLPENSPGYFPFGIMEESLRVAFHVFIYCFTVRSSFNFDWLYSPWLIAGAALCFLSLMIFFPKRRNWIHLGFGWLPLVVSLFVPIYFYHLLLYHVLIWIFFPALNQFRHEPQRLKLHLLTNVGLSTLFLLVLFVYQDPFRYETWEACQPFLLIGTYIHITSSFALSSLNPLWIRRIWLQ